MKTSHILLAIIAVITLTGMVATDVLLKQQYEKIDWRNPYQDFVQRPLPTAKHWVIEGTPANEIVVLKSNGKPQALVEPEAIKFYRTRQQGDTVFITFTPDYSGYIQTEPRFSADHELWARLVLQLPDLQTLQIKNARLTIRELATNQLTISLQNSRLRTDNLKILETLSLRAIGNSFAVLGPADQYKSLQTVVQDSSGVQLNNARTDAFTTQVSPKAEVQLRGQALKWLR